jgi:hypothetical protein
MVRLEADPWGMLEDRTARRTIDPTTQYRPDVTELTGDLRRSEIVELLEQMHFGLWCESTCTVISIVMFETPSCSR